MISQVLAQNIHEDSFEKAKERDTELSNLVVLGTVEKRVKINPDLLLSGGEQSRVALLKTEVGIHAANIYPGATHIFDFQEEETDPKEPFRPRHFRVTGTAYGAKQ